MLRYELKTITCCFCKKYIIDNYINLNNNKFHSYCYEYMITIKRDLCF